MQYILIGIVGTFIWIAFEMWRAPMMDEQTGKILKKGKTLKDLFKTNIKKSQTYSDLEKLGRGRSKY